MRMLEWIDRRVSGSDLAGNMSYLTPIHIHATGRLGSAGLLLPDSVP
jgi:hypothetical protein